MAESKVTDSEKATVWAVWNGRRGSRRGGNSHLDDLASASLAGSVKTGEYNLVDIGAIAEWAAYSPDNLADACVVATTGESRYVAPAGALGHQVGMRRATYFSQRAQEALEDMLQYLDAQTGAGIRDILSFLAYMHRDAGLFCRMHGGA